MKLFSQFTESVAVQQATRMGLKSDGHGGWYDKKGEFVAKTERGSLKFFNKRQRVGQQDPPQSDKEKNLSAPSSFNLFYIVLIQNPYLFVYLTPRRSNVAYDFSVSYESNHN